VAGGKPVPVKFTNCGLPVELSETFKVAERGPVVVGVNVTLIAQFAPAATLDPQLVVSAKSPGLPPSTEIPVMLSAAFPEMAKAPCGSFSTVRRFACAVN
jgi:hypothetical protein